MIRHSPWPAAVLLALLLVWAPLPFGSVTPWAAALLEVLAFVALAVALGTVRDLARLRPARAAAASVAAVAALGFAQSLPWPRFLAGWLSPGHVALSAAAAPLLAGGGVDAGPVRLSVAPGVSRWAALAWLAVAAALLAAAVAGRRRGPRRLLAGAVLAVALFEAIYGARGWFARAEEIWGVAVSTDLSRLRGTFVNPNHLATHLLLALAVAFALVWWAVRRARRLPRWEDRLLVVVPPLLLWLVLFAALAFTGSRAGMLAALAGIAAQGALLAAARRSWRPAAAVAVLLTLGLGWVAATGLREGFERFWGAGSEAGLAERVTAYERAFELWRRYPWTGTGLGTFREAFPMVQPASLEGSWWHLHSDPLELLVTTGVVGVALLAAGVPFLLRRLWRVLAGKLRSEDRAAALAASGALVAVGAQELFDFGLTLPANAVTLAVLVGAAAAVPGAHAECASGGREALTPLPDREAPPAPAARARRRSGSPPPGGGGRRRPAAGR